MSTELPTLPYGRQQIDDDDVAAVSAVLRGDWLTTGPAVAAFEQALAERVGARYAVACSSGTAALHLAALALELAPGQRAAVPSLTFVATANAARYAGADVSFADCDPDTGLMRGNDLQRLLTGPQGNAITAVCPVHLAGQVADLPGIAALARNRGLKIVEDASHAIGTSYRDPDNGEWVAVGSCRHSDITVFSFHPVKTIAMGEGGALTTNDPALYERLCELRTHGLTRDPARFEQRQHAFDADGAANPWYYEQQALGFNYRASDIHCALGLSQLAKLDRFVEQRAALVQRYDRLLADLAPTLRPLARRGDCRPGWHLYVVLIDFAALGRERAAVMRELRECGILSQVHYIPTHRQPYYRQLYGDLTLPGTDAYYDRALSLPLFPGMTEQDVDRVALALHEVVAGSGARAS